MKITNPNAYHAFCTDRLIKLEVTVLLDSVPGTWHQPEDIMNWINQHSYVQSVELKETGG